MVIKTQTKRIIKEEKFMSYINENEKTKCHAIIHSASAASGVAGAGLAWIPCSDSVIISGLQIGMVISIGKVFGIKVTKSMAKAAIAAAAATTAGRTVSQLATFWIPFANVAINASTATGITEFIGWQIAEEYAKQTKSCEI